MVIHNFGLKVISRLNFELEAIVLPKGWWNQIWSKSIHNETNVNFTVRIVVVHRHVHHFWLWVIIGHPRQYLLPWHSTLLFHHYNKTQRKKRWIINHQILYLAFGQNMVESNEKHSYKNKISMYFESFMLYLRRASKIKTFKKHMFCVLCNNT